MRMKVMRFVFLMLFFQKGHSRDHNWNLYNFTTDRVNGDYEKNDGIVKDKCIVKLIRESVNEFGSTYMFILDDLYHIYLLRKLQVKFVHSHFTEPIQLSYSQTDIFDNLLIFRNKFKLREVIEKKKPFQATKFFLLVRNYQEAIRKFEILWEYRLVNAVASFVVNTTAFYYTYFPYSETHCGKVGQPYLLAKCDISNGVYSFREKLFPSKVHDLHGCQIKTSFVENVPSAYYDKTKKLTGWEIELMNEILERVNGVPDYDVYNTKKPSYKTQLGYRRLVENSEIGVGLVISLKGLVETDFCMYGMALCTTWIEPKRESYPFSADFLAKVFPPGVWLLLLLVYMVMAASFYGFLKGRIYNIIFKLLPFLLGTTTTTRRISGRKQLQALWLWFCLIMTAVYQCGFQSTLLVPNLPQQLGTTNNIMESNLKILGVSEIITDIRPYFKERFNVSGQRFRTRKLSYENWIHRMVVKKDSAYFGFREVVRYHVERTQLANEIYIPETCIMKYLLAFVLKRNSHLTEVLVKFSNRLNENGFVTYFVRKHLSRESRQNVPKKLMNILKPLKRGDVTEPSPPINLNRMIVILICLAAGILLGLVAFVTELMTIWDWKKIKKGAIQELQSACPCY